jgi:hypothetical protein
MRQDTMYSRRTLGAMEQSAADRFSADRTLDPSQAEGLLNRGSNLADSWQAFQLVATRFLATRFLAGLSLSVAGELLLQSLLWQQNER